MDLISTAEHLATTTKPTKPGQSYINHPRRVAQRAAILAWPRTSPPKYAKSTPKLLLDIHPDQEKPDKEGNAGGGGVCVDRS